MKTTSFSLARILVYALMISSLMLSLSPGVEPAALAQSELPGNPGAGGNLTPTPPPPPHITTDAETGVVRFMGGSKQAPLVLTSTADAAAKSPREIAEGFLQVQGSAFGLGEGAGLSVLRETSTADGRTFERFQQTYQGVPVLGGELIVQMDDSKNVLSTSGQVSSKLNLDVTPGLDAAAAQAAALVATKEEYPEVAADQLTPSETALYVYDTQLFVRFSAPAQKLVWQVIVGTSFHEGAQKTVVPVRQVVLVDAHSGGIVRQFSTLDTALNRTIVDCDGGNCNLAYYYRTEDQHYWEGYSTDGNNAFDYLGAVYNFYKNKYGRDSINAKGMKLWAFFNYLPDGQNTYLNAFWNGYEMVFGPDFVTDDVTGHEMTHGVTQYESHLIYLDQSGAINESFSDIWGEWIDQSYTNGYDGDSAGVKWLMGEDLPIGASRSMKDPTLFSDPDKVSSPYYYCGFNDNGGVHTNSGVGNKAAYLITDGGDFNNKHIVGLGSDKASQIYYDVQANLLTSKAEYPDLADALHNSCTSLIGQYGITQDDCTNVDLAIEATEMNTTPCMGLRGYMNSTSTVVLSPIGNIGTQLNPVLDWRQEANATKYQVRVKDSKGKVIYQEWKNNDLVTCPNSHCLANLPNPLKYGEHYSWAVLTHNYFGDGPWSPAKSFYTTYPAGLPPQITPDSPVNTIVATALPDFKWPPVNGATGYVLKINQTAPVAKAYLSMTLKPETTCLPGVGVLCKVKPAKALVPGTFQWTVSAKFGTQIGPDLDPLAQFSVQDLPAKVVISTPDGYAAVNSLTPQATWPADDNAASYIVTILGTAGKIVRTYGTGGCVAQVCTVVLPRLEGGKQILTVQAASAVGKGPVSDKRIFTISPPSNVSNLAPSGDVNDTNRPTFSWTGDPLATQYTLHISGPVNFNKIYKDSDICSGTDCQVRSEVTLKQGNYQWSVTARNKAGSKTLGSAFVILLPPGTVPNAPVLISPPINHIVGTDEALALEWSNSSAFVDEFILKLSGPNHFVETSYLSKTGLCGGGSDCTLTYPHPLALGRYTWTVTASNHGVLSKTSKVFTFYIGLPKPVIISPADGSTPTLYQLSAVWQPVTGAKAYNVQLVNGLNKTLFNKTLVAALVCSGSTCTTLLPAGLPASLPAANYKLLVKGLHSTGFGVARTSNFIFSPPMVAEFNGTWDGWSDAGSTSHWYLASNNKYASNTGRDDLFSHAWELLGDGKSYGDMDLQFATQRFSGTEWAMGALIRGTVSPGTTDITEGYLFNIATEGWLCVRRIHNGLDTFLQPWTRTSLVHRGAAWNTLRVVAVGEQFWFFINGRLAWVGSDSSISSGNTYLGMYSVSPSDELNIDWAHGYTDPGLTALHRLGAVDPAQQALNQTAGAQKTGAQAAAGNHNHIPTYSGH